MAYGRFIMIPAASSFVFMTVGEFEDFVPWTFAESCLLGCGTVYPDRRLAKGLRNPLTPNCRTDDMSFIQNVNKFLAHNMASRSKSHLVLQFSGFQLIYNLTRQ